ncbi:podocalyxin [Emydura macquarii macquarii]|uniref:podocalyxin n=1 Tax=Emydura macquarii macquarii TaxID=1129001 RepID=UPI00352AB9AD
MRCALLLLVLLRCRGDANEQAKNAIISPTSVTSKGSQSPTDTTGTPPSTSTPSPTKADTSPSANTSIRPGASNPLPTTSSAPLSATLPSALNVVISNIINNPPNTGTPARTDTSALPPVDLSAPTTKAGATTKVPEVVASPTIGSANPIIGTPSDSTTTPGVSAFSSAAAPAASTSSVATPAAATTVASRAATAAATTDIPSSAGTPPEVGGPASASSSRKPETSVTIPDKEEATKSAPQASGTIMESTTKPRKTTVGTTWQSGISQTPSSSSGSPKTSKSPHHHSPVPTREPWKSSMNQIVCVPQTQPNDSAVILTLNKSNPCDSPLDESLHNVLCKAVKETFNRSRDGCTVRLAGAGYPADKIAVLGISVQTSATAEELFKLLEVKKGELQKVGISNVTYPGMLREEDNEDRFSMPLIIAIVCMACALLLVAAIYGCCHQRLAHRKDQQRLTEELQTMENGYHDNPTLEVMETGSEMQEKKVNLNGEVGDCWIVPLHSLTKEELEEEDTHL